MKYAVLCFVFCFNYFFANAQKDTLPAFTAKKRLGEITISWVNAYKNATQINIQRSKDSNRNFVTIHSTPNPAAKTYSYLDKTAKNDSGYYRIFLLFEGTNYIFTKSKRAVEEPVATVNKVQTEKPLTEKNNPTDVTKEEVDINGTGPVGLKSKNAKPGDKISGPVNSKPVKKVWEPSPYVFTADDGNIRINLPEAATKKYSITFLREEGRPVFVIPQVKETKLTLDKAVFLKSGWYYFELKEDGKVKERNKFLITRDN